jgi:hypothetical protein
MPIELIALVDSFAEAMDGSATADELTAIRDKLDSYLFSENVRAKLDRINNPDRVGALVDALRALQRKAEALLHQRSNHREMFRIGGIGGGAGFAGASLLAMFAVSTPAGLLLPLLAGGYMVGRSVVVSNQTSTEIVVLEAIVERCRLLAEYKER